jgi:hypothetical protein
MLPHLIRITQRITHMNVYREFENAWVDHNVRNTSGTQARLYDARMRMQAAPDYNEDSYREAVDNAERTATVTRLLSRGKPLTHRKCPNCGQVEIADSDEHAVIVKGRDRCGTPVEQWHRIGTIESLAGRGSS